MLGRFSAMFAQPYSLTARRKPVYVEPLKENTEITRRQMQAMMFSNPLPIPRPSVQEDGVCRSASPAVFDDDCHVS